MSDSDVKAIALFFFFTMLDEKRAILAAAQAYEHCLGQLKKSEDEDGEPTQRPSNNQLIVAATYKVWKSHRSKLIRGRPQYSLNSGWKIPTKIDFSVWKDFQKNASEGDLLALVWSKILNFSEIEISMGLGLSIGTVRYRVSHALRRLGEYQGVSGPTVSL